MTRLCVCLFLSSRDSDESSRQKGSGNGKDKVNDNQPNDHGRISSNPHAIEAPFGDPDISQVSVEKSLVLKEN
jgi:hypothetical protein